MNAVEIEQAITDLAERPFDCANFPYSFLEAFGNKETTIKRLRTGASNKSDLGGVLQTSNIHILTCATGAVPASLKALNDSPATAKAKARFILATDGVDFEAEDLESGETMACGFASFPDHFGFFLPLAGISTVRQITENAFDIRATSRLNRLYVELLKDNPEWGKGARRHEMNHFMARLIFCFFAEDTSIFVGKGKFTETVALMSAKDSSNTHEVISTLFRAMNTKRDKLVAANTPRWAEDFPYVNGGLFAGSVDVPRFSRIARSYLLHVGGLDWTRINPDIFGSMIQAVADEEERSELGMHYTSVPNILKVLNPLFLDDLREKLAEAGDNHRTLLHLRKRMARIRVFDPACGSGNFLVIAYKELRAIEADINKRRGEPDRRSDLPLTNFRGIELRDFPAEIARLALVIAEYQCDVLYRGPMLALAEFLPLHDENWITTGNALRLDWSSVCPPTGTSVKVRGDELFGSHHHRADVEFTNEGGETYICGNPPYSGKGKKEDQHLQDMEFVFSGRTKKYGYIDYVGCWFVLAAEYCRRANAVAALVATNSVCQGRQLPQLWQQVLGRDLEIVFAHPSFKWSNSATHNAGVTCVIVGIAGKGQRSQKVLFDGDFARIVPTINPYLVPGSDVVVESHPRPLSRLLPVMQTGSVPNDGGRLILNPGEVGSLAREAPESMDFVHRFFGSEDYLQGMVRSCLVISDSQVDRATGIASIARRLDDVRELRSKSKKRETRELLAHVPHRFQHRAPIPNELAIIVPSVSSERRAYFPAGILPAGTVISNLAFMLVDAPLWTLSVLVSSLHLVWIATVCGKLETRYRYSNTLGWNTFPVPLLTDKNKADLTRCAKNILMARENHFPATIAELYAPDKMPDDLRAAHEHNDEVLERFYVGRRFKNDTERLEKLFELYTKMTAAAAPASGKPRKSGP